MKAIVRTLEVFFVKAFLECPAGPAVRSIRFSRLRRRRKMKRIPEVLQLPAIIDWGRLLASQLQRLQELDFLFGDIAT